MLSSLETKGLVLTSHAKLSECTPVDVKYIIPMSQSGQL